MAPALILSLTLATLYGCGCHAIVGRRLWQWPLYWGSAVVGFFGGYFGAVAFGFNWLQIGSVPFLASTLGAITFLWLIWFFTTPYASAPQN